MTEILIWGIGALAALGGIVLGRLWGRLEGKRAGKQEAERDAMEDKNRRVERGRDAVRDGRGAGDPAQRSAGRRSTGAPPSSASPPQRWALVTRAVRRMPRHGLPDRLPTLSPPFRRRGQAGSLIWMTA